MADTPDTLAAWLEQTDISAHRLTEQQQAVLEAAFHFRQTVGADYYSTRLLGHFLLHCQSGLKVAAIARLLGISRPTASEQQGLSSQQVVRQAHQRMAGRPHGKLLPRYAGPIAGFLLAQPDASRKELLDFIATTFAVRVSRIALYKFLKKYGLNRVETSAPLTSGPATDTPGPANPLLSAAPQPEPIPDPGTVPVPVISPPVVPAPDTDSVVKALPPIAPVPTPVVVPVWVAMPASVTVLTSVPLDPPLERTTAPVAVPAAAPAPPLCSHGRSTRAPSC